MNIKEIALKVAREMPNGFLWSEGCDHESGIIEQEVIEFAEALVAELAKGNDPFGYYYEINRTWDAFAVGKTEPDDDVYDEGSLKALYTLPPTASQIEQETAEAIAAFIRSNGIGFADDDEELNRIAEAIRSGAWKGFKND